MSKHLHKHLVSGLLVASIAAAGVLSVAAQEGSQGRGTPNDQVTAVSSNRASAPVSLPLSLAPEWVAVRQQYETSYQPIVVERPELNVVQSTQPASLAPEWVAVRQQYETSYQP